jgi:hypothetical protein
LRRLLRQRTASLDLKRGNIWQLGGGSGDARSIFDGRLLRLYGRLLRLDGRLLRLDGRLLGRGDASENENCRPLLRSEGHVAFVFKVNRAPRFERVGIENLLILFATRGAGRLIAGRFDDPNLAGRTSKAVRTTGAGRTWGTGGADGAARTSLTLGRLALSASSQEKGG